MIIVHTQTSEKLQDNGRFLCALPLANQSAPTVYVPLLTAPSCVGGTDFCAQPKE